MEGRDHGGRERRRRARRPHRPPHPRQRGRGVPRLEGRRRPTTSCIAPDRRARARARSSRSAARAGAPAVARFLALAVLGFLFATYLAEPLHFGRSDNCGRVLRVPRGRARSCSRSCAGCSAAGHRYLPARARARGHRRAARRRPPGRRPARAQHRVRLLGDRRHPGVGPGQHHVLAAHRGGAAARRARGVATARPRHRATR